MSSSGRWVDDSCRGVRVLSRPCPLARHQGIRCRIYACAMELCRRGLPVVRPNSCYTGDLFFVSIAPRVSVDHGGG